jgi:two-component system, NarL family, invasion response regulator UvrY
MCGPDGGHAGVVSIIQIDIPKQQYENLLQWHQSPGRNGISLRPVAPRLKDSLPAFGPWLKRMPAILIIDGDWLTRQGLKQTLSEEYRGVTFGEAPNGTEALAQVSRTSWDLVILEITLPDRDGFVVLQEICHRFPRMPVVVISMYPDSQYVSRAQRMGAVGYVGKNAGRVALLRAFRSVLAGEKYFPTLEAPEAQGTAQLVPASLSGREYGVMLALAAGKRASDIATELDLSVKTVSTYKKRVLNKLHLRSLADLVHYVVNHGLS